ncbi:MAG: NYN domain-containing protein [Phycisphaerae bacterium]
MARANVYIGGFNLYYGAVKDTAYKWLNIERLFTLLRNHDDIQRIYYFTALIKGSHLLNQLTYVKALATLPRVQVILGKYKLRAVLCNVPGCKYTGNRRFFVPEEKRTDTQIALTMAQDAWDDACDLFVLVSGDSDLVPAVGKVKEIAPHKRILVYVPARDAIRGAAVELRGVADKHRTLPNQLIRRSQFAASIPDGQGGWIDKPAGW